MNSGAVLSIAAAAVSSGTPVVLAATGEVVAERAGVLNLGLEGMMVVGALAGFAAASATGSPVLGLAAAMGAGAVLALVHAFVTITMRGDAVVSGLALVLLGSGIASLAGAPLVGEVAPRLDRGLGIGLSLAAVAGTWVFLRHTRPGLVLAVVGESPETADALGVRVLAVRYGAVLFGGLMAGAGGAYLSLVDTPSWSEGMTGGKGWIALAMVVFGGWSPVGAALGAYLFGGSTAIQLRLQARQIDVSPFLLGMAPYLLTIALLVLYSATPLRRHHAPPAALGRPYRRE